MSSSSAMLDAPKTTDKWESEDEFEARLQRIQSNIGNSDTKGNINSDAPDSEAMAALRTDVNKFKQLLDEARRRIQQLENEAIKVQKRDADNEKMLEEKSEQIRELETIVKELRAKTNSTVSEEELIALHGELERERATMDEDRTAMENQFRQLELSMARERAEIARERNELQRTKSDLKHKLDAIEKTQSDMSPLKRLRDELRGDQGAAILNPHAKAPTNIPTLPALPALNRKAPEGEDTPRRSGILSRILGKPGQQQ
jgi:chromosome segregation ATPase